MSHPKPIKLALLWHMHQPDYSDPDSGVLNFPWVRFHALKDYLDMPLHAARHENVRVTFNLAPSLIDQLEHYLNDGTDLQLELTRIDASQADELQRREILGNSFNCNVDTMVKPFERYFQMYQKWQRTQSSRSVDEFTVDEIRDTQVWSNLCWVDPMFRNDPALAPLFQKGEGFSEEDKQSLLNWQIEHIGRIIPTYKKLFQQGRIDLSFSPYYHPILPLLCDSESAREALPGVQLPSQRFQHPEDARRQIEMAMEKFENLFERKMAGMWPSEGSLSEESALLCAELGLDWLASDEQVLYRSLQKSGMDTATNHPHTVYDYGPGLKILFRDHALSDRIGFVYSRWDAEEAAADFIEHIKSLRLRLVDQLDEVVVSVILDGENAWEYFPNDGNDFLEALYRNMAEAPEIETVTMSQAARQMPSRNLTSLFAGSWINHNFRIWIGHEEDNAAWEHLLKAREFLYSFQKANPGFNRGQIELAWRKIYIAEGSDWFWWYGDEHRGPDNHKFDQMFRKHLMAVYKLLGQGIPDELHQPISAYTYKLPLLLPDALVTPEIDGEITHFYEWFGAGRLQCLTADTAMHRSFRIISNIHYGFDHKSFYIRLDFANGNTLKQKTNLRFVIDLLKPEKWQIDLECGVAPSTGGVEGQYCFAFGDIMELAVDRSFLWTEGFGKLAFRVIVYENEKQLENWPEGDVIKCDLPEKHKELFWHP